jgi:hypothetical protein
MLLSTITIQIMLLSTITIQVQVCQLSDTAWIKFVATFHGDPFLFIAVF